LRNPDISRARGVTAVLGPTNTGKTHLAIERMLGHESGLIGLPLRLLAREVYDKIAARAGAEQVALITGEEKIKPDRARFWVCTVEAMPRDIEVDFLAIDEVQLAGDPERGHVFTDRLLHARGRAETLLLGAQTMRETINDLLPGANHISRPRLSKLTYAGSKKLSRLPRRSGIVAFSANDVYAVAELIRRQRGGAAVVLGALSPRTRNAQVALYQSGDVDYLVATDAIGMGLNLDLDHVAFSGIRKFDGHTHRNLTPGELGQIAGRAGRHMNDGTFGVTGDVEALEPDLVERLENHSFESVRVLQWRNRDLDFASLDRLRDSLRELPAIARLQRARMADDTIALENLSLDRETAELAATPAAVRLLWDVCQIPDYRKISSANHSELLGQVFKFLRTGEERIPEDWLARQVDLADRTDGDIDTLATRIAHIRTWTFVSNRSEWLAQPEHWQGRAREIEDKLSDALHERLTQRFVDRRTSVLMRKLNDKDELVAEIANDGAIDVEGQFVGRLVGFRFFPDTTSSDANARAARNAASQVVAKELVMRARRVASAQADAFKLARSGVVTWRGEEIARLEKADDPLKPVVQLVADEYLSGPDRERVQKRLDDWIAAAIDDKLKPLTAIAKATDITGLARGIAFRLTEGFGILKREPLAEELKELDQTARAQLRKYGVRFGAFNIYFPLLLKPAASELILMLWALRHAGEHGLDAADLPEPPRPGLTSVPADAGVPEAYYRVVGYHVCGPRAVRVDMLERLADLIRPLTAWRANAESPSLPPKGASGNGGFIIIPEMMSIMGCGADELGNVLRSLGFWVERRRKAAAPAAVTEPAAPDGVAPAEATPAEAVSVAPETLTTASADDGAIAVESAPLEEAAAAAPEPESTDAAAPPSGDALVSNEAPIPAGVAQEPTAATASEAAGKPEPEYEEVWRPRRRVAFERRERRPGREASANGEPARDKRERRGKPWRDRHGGKEGAGETRPAAPTEGAPQAEATAKPEGSGARPQHDSGRPRRHDGGRRDRDHRDKRDERRPRREDRDRRRDGDRPRVFASTEGKRGGAADPDSPFAALGRLKAQLEKRPEGDSSS
jgi:ATP-dependent RNA helicase SUPV3L1/SUV3